MNIISKKSNRLNRRNVEFAREQVKLQGGKYTRQYLSDTSKFFNDNLCVFSHAYKINGRELKQKIKYYKGLFYSIPSKIEVVMTAIYSLAISNGYNPSLHKSDLYATPPSTSLIQDLFSYFN